MKNYEFRSQSLKQKSILIGIRIFILLSLSFYIYSLAEEISVSVPEKVRTVSNIFTGFWLYANVLQAKIEIQELFVPPFNIKNSVEFMAIATSLYLVSFFL